ncbi:MAG TPA: non-homologous end-joining DNA ligase [Verrucomicrobiae bacterium]|nr:non-homologous end-joining DNA ligase [Verrucomicrobiae bacterium]
MSADGAARRPYRVQRFNLMSLKEYKRKRDFRQTREPAGKIAPRKEKGLQFVIQKHAASHLHYDFRLEMEGVLKSWAVPKGLPMKRGDRRLAVEVEDHPLDYGGFEGTIPPGNYGAGTVMLWDHGTYKVASGDPLEALKNGKLHLTLAGKKLKGDWALVRMRPRETDSKPQWLIFKSGEDAPAIPARAEDRSVVSRKSMEEIASGDSPQWQSNRQTTKRVKKTKPANTVEPVIGADLSKLPREKPHFIEPMKCLLVEELPKAGDWVFEIKFDGVRALGIKTGAKISLISRNEKDLTQKYSPVAEALRSLPCRDALIDGEVVAVDEQGRSRFQLLQNYEMPGREKPPLLYYAFDLLNLDGRDLKGLPLTRRKEILKSLVASVPEIIFFSAGIEADSQRVLKAMKSRGLEGLVAKRKDSKYEPGRRSPAWQKYKWTLEQEFVIGGYTPPKGARSHFGALLVGYYEKGKLMFASKVGTGFDEKLLKHLHEKFQKLIQRDCPFANLPTKHSSGAIALGPAEMSRCTWLKPRLVCEIRFSEWTEEGRLRQPVFLGLREDKKAFEVVREMAK